ncbi:MAG: HAD family hydrolase [Actinobacteria bacterium]|nr:MAG: HAD family hydrolase [Actinomycetota bacterium]
MRAAAEVARLEGEGHTVLVVTRGEEALGLIGVADEVRPEAPGVVRHLHALGVEHTVMLTGDNEATGAAVARHVGVTGHMARLLPARKVDAVRHLKERYGVVAMVGDGINDAPALAAADIGIAMGAAGSDAALETADVALMSDDLAALPRFFDLGRRTVINIRQNVTFSVAVKAATLVAAVLGYAPLWLAVFADTGVALLVVLNGLRLLGAPRRAGAGAPAA